MMMPSLSRCWMCRLTGSVHKPVTGYASPHSDRLQDPNCDRNHDHYIQNRLDAAGHGDIPIDQPQPDARYDQRNDDVYQGHFLYSPKTLSSNPLPSRRRLPFGFTGTTRRETQPLRIDAPDPKSAV